MDRYLNSLVLSGLFDNPAFIVVGIILLFGVIGLIAFLLQKYVPSLKNTDKKKGEKEIAEEEVKRLIETDDNLEMKEQVKEVLKKSEEDLKKPTEDEILRDEMSRTIEDVDDKETIEAMNKYREEHPEEEQEAEKSQKEDEKR